LECGGDPDLVDKVLFLAPFLASSLPPIIPLPFFYLQF
jgi:hypothetical protein